MSSLNKVVIFLCLIMFSSCLREEEPIPPYPRGDIREVVLDMKDKNDIVFYNLETNAEVGRARPEDWDLYFGDNQIKINYLRSMRVAKWSGSMGIKMDTSGLDFSFDEISESCNWCLGQQTYILDMGFNEDLTRHYGFLQIRLEKENNKYTLTYSGLDQSDSTVMQLSQDEHYFSIMNEQAVQLPAEEEYTIVFGKYNYYFEVEKLDYQVFGALLGNASAEKVDVPFEQISMNVIDTLQFSERQDAVGFDWKSYNLNKGAYEIDFTKNYVIKSQSGFIYKLRFTNFYNSKGVSGHPTFEYNLL